MRSFRTAQPHLAQNMYIALRTICPFDELRDDEAMYRMAQQQLQDADAESPGFRHSDYLITLGWAECRVGRWQEALQSFSSAESSDYMRLWDHYGLTLGKAVALHHTGQQEESLRQLVLAHRKLQQDSVEAFRFFLRRNLMKQALAICGRDQSETLACIDKLAATG